MTVNGISQTFSFTAVRLSVSDRSGPAAAIPAKSATSTIEPGRVTLSSAKAEPVSRAKRRADALFGALDADQDGAITEQEFTEGAIALLRHAGDRRRVRGDDEGAERGSRGVRRLERKLEKAFGRVDANDDGAIDKQELTTALAQVAKRRGDRSPVPPAEPPPPQDPAQPTQSGTTITFTFTYVSVAVQRYTSLQPPKDVTPEAAKDTPTRSFEAPAVATGTEPAVAALEPRRAA